MQTEPAYIYQHGKYAVRVWLSWAFQLKIDISVAISFGIYFSYKHLTFKFDL